MGISLSSSRFALIPKSVGAYSSSTEGAALSRFALIPKSVGAYCEVKDTGESQCFALIPKSVGAYSPIVRLAGSELYQSCICSGMSSASASEAGDP